MDKELREKNRLYKSEEVKQFIKDFFGEYLLAQKLQRPFNANIDKWFDEKREK